MTTSSTPPERITFQASEHAHAYAEPMLDEERALFSAHRDFWLPEHRGDFVLIKGDRLIGFFKQEDDALAEGARRFGLDSFLIREVAEEETEVSIPAVALGLLASLHHR